MNILDLPPERWLSRLFVCGDKSCLVDFPVAMLPKLIIAALGFGSIACAGVVSTRAARNPRSSTLKLTRRHGKSSPSSQHLRKVMASTSVLPLEELDMESDFATEYRAGAKQPQMLSGGIRSIVG